MEYVNLLRQYLLSGKEINSSTIENFNGVYANHLYRAIRDLRQEGLNIRYNSFEKDGEYYSVFKIFGENETPFYSQSRPYFAAFNEYLNVYGTIMRKDARVVCWNKNEIAVEAAFRYFVKSTSAQHGQYGPRRVTIVSVDAISLQARLIAEGLNVPTTNEILEQYLLEHGTLTADDVINIFPDRSKGTLWAALSDFWKIIEPKVGVFRYMSRNLKAGKGKAIIYTNHSALVARMHAMDISYQIRAAEIELVDTVISRLYSAHNATVSYTHLTLPTNREV